MNECLAELARVLREARKKSGLTQVQLAELIDTDARTIMNIENCNDDNPKMETLVSIFQFFKIDTNVVFFPYRNEKRPAIVDMELELNDCSEEEIRALIPICRCILESTKSLHKISAI